MSPFRTALLTGALTLVLGAGLVASWLHFRPLEIPRFARVNIGALVAQQQQSLVERVKPGMEATEQARLFEDAKAFGLRLDAALDQVAQECQCALINSAALLKASPVAAIPDWSARVAEIVGTAPASPSAQ
jgi:hypothetical protein